MLSSPARMLSGMGFELEMDSVGRRRDGMPDLDERITTLSRRWVAADERLRLAQAACRELRGHVEPSDPRLIGAQLRLAQTRYRRHELDLEIGRLEQELEMPQD